MVEILQHTAHLSFSVLRSVLATIFFVVVQRERMHELFLDPASGGKELSLSVTL